MSFFDKFFISRNRKNNNESAVTSESELLCFRSSHLRISKDQIRFILFRECDKRGRKLLFDSNSVEKIVLPSSGNMCNHKYQRKSEKMGDFIETHETYAYKYKKPLSDVSSLGELVFGSVAVIYKGEYSCKIHSIPSPKRLMFSTIVNAPSRCPTNTVSEFNLNGSEESSSASLNNILNDQLTSSSDSKLYKREGASQKYSSTYPWIKQTFPLRKIKQCCEISGVHHNLTKSSLFKQSSDLKYLESWCIHKGSRICSECRSKEATPTKVDHLISGESSLCQENFDSERDSYNYDSSGITSNESDNLSSISGSLCSFKRRWIHSYSTSLDSTTFDDGSSSSCKKRTKLGMALILDLSNTFEDEIEKLLFNHTIVIDSAMRKLQAFVELGYIRNENFVDLIHTAFLECQQSIYQLITSGKYEMPMWCLKNVNINLETNMTDVDHYEKNMGMCSKQDFISNIQLKFLIDFCEVLSKFDTKDTNFFISTLLTAVLTHHLSWVTSVAETDLKFSNEKLSVINSNPPYNPIWAQMNDLCGLLGSPLKSAKTVITGTRKNQVTAIIKILSYFIRCNNVAENIYEVDVEDIVGNMGNINFESPKTKFDCVNNVSNKISIEKQSINSSIAFKNETENCWTGKQKTEERLENKMSLLKEPNYKKSESDGGLKRTKSYLSYTKLEDAIRLNELYPDIKDIAKLENVNLSDLNHVENERCTFASNFPSSKKHKEKVGKVIRISRQSITPPTEELLNLGGDYETIDLAKTDNYRESKIHIERQCSAAPEGKKENIIFLLGENEELVNLQKKIVVSKSSFVDMKKKDLRELPSEKDKDFSEERTFFRDRVSNESECEGSSRTLESLYDVDGRTLQLNFGSENIKKSIGEGNLLEKTPWIFQEMNFPRTAKPCLSRRLEVSSVMGGVNEHFNSEQIIQGVLEPKNLLEQALHKDLLICAHDPILEKNIKEALCILGDMSSWEVSILSGNGSEGLNRHKQSEIRVGMSQLVADMLESFQYLQTCSLPPNFCLDHIEKKLRDIYLKSITVAELLTSTELCSVEYLTAKLDIGINDIPLLLSVATTHSPHIAKKYTLSFS